MIGWEDLMEGRPPTSKYKLNIDLISKVIVIQGESTGNCMGSVYPARGKCHQQTSRRAENSFDYGALLRLSMKSWARLKCQSQQWMWLYIPPELKIITVWQDLCKFVVNMGILHWMWLQKNCSNFKLYCTVKCHRSKKQQNHRKDLNTHTHNPINV